MADPFTIISAITLVISTVTSVIGSISQGNAKAKAHTTNEFTAMAQANLARDKAKLNAAAFDREKRRRFGAMRVAVAGSGITIEGSPLDLFEQSAAEAKLDELHILYKGEAEAIGLLRTAGFEGMAADEAVTQGIIGGASALLQGVSQGAALPGSAKTLSSGGNSTLVPNTSGNFNSLRSGTGETQIPTGFVS